MTHIREQLRPEIPDSPVPSAGRTTESSPRRIPYLRRAAVVRVAEINERYAPTVLRVALALVFVWFGALKLSGDSPVRELLASTLPFFDPDISVPVIGAVEVVIGIALLIGRFPRITLLVLAGHLVGTFLTFITATKLMVQHGNPWQLTADGEFVVKNLVMISAALVLIGYYSRRTRARVLD